MTHTIWLIFFLISAALFNVYGLYLARIYRIGVTEYYNRYFSEKGYRDYQMSFAVAWIVSAITATACIAIGTYLLIV